MKIFVISSHTQSLFWFRLDLMKEFVSRGHRVIAIGSESEKEWKQKFEKFNIDYRQIPVQRNGINPLKDIKYLTYLYKLMKKEKPNKVFAYQAKSVIYGSLAAKLNNNIEVYPLIAGLGSIFRGKGIKNSLVKSILNIQYKLAFKNSEKIFFQNSDDKNELIKNGLLEEGQAVVVNGSGVNLGQFKPVPYPSVMAFLFIGRLIKDKGIIEYLEACKNIKSKYPNIRCLLVGPFDSNPSALDPKELQPYIEHGIIEYFGEQQDVRPFISQCSVFVLPSYHEGTPKTILESMAMGRAIITSDAPGCRETVIDGLNGYLTLVKDIQDLSYKMDALISNPELCAEMGKRSVEIAVNKYDVNKVNANILKVMGIY